MTMTVLTPALSVTKEDVLKDLEDLEDLLQNFLDLVDLVVLHLVDLEIITLENKKEPFFKHNFIWLII